MMAGTSSFPAPIITEINPWKDIKTRGPGVIRAKSADKIGRSNSLGPYPTNLPRHSSHRGPGSITCKTSSSKGTPAIITSSDNADKQGSHTIASQLFPHDEECSKSLGRPVSLGPVPL